MNFSNPLILFGLFAIAAPIIIHLLNRRRHRVVKWAAMEFILKATRESRGKKKLKHIIILTARALIIAGLVFAFSDPFKNRLGAAGIPDTVILVLDRSPSMELITNEGTAGEGKSKREIAIESIKKTMKDMPETRLLLLDSATNKLTEISSPETLDSISQTTLSHKSANIPKLIASAISYATNEDEKLGNAEVWVASDLQLSNWQPEAKQWKSVSTMLENSEHVKLRFMALNETSDSNYSIKVHRTFREGNSLAIELEINRTDGSQPKNIEVQCNINNKISSPHVIEMTSSSIRKRITLPLASTAEDGFGFVSLSADTNILDNVSYFVYGKKTSLETIIVSEQGSSLRALKRAAAPPGFKHLSTRVIKPKDADDLDLDGTPLLIWQAPLPEGNIAEKITEYIEDGGLVLFFPPEGDSSTAFMDLQWGPVQKAGSNEYFLIDSWNKNDGPFRNGLDGRNLPLEKIDTITRRTIKGDAIPLASYEDGELFSTRKIIGRGRAVFISTLPDLKWSHFQKLNLITTHRMLEIATERFNANSTTTVGSDLLKLRPRENRNRLDTYTKEQPNNAEHEAGIWGLGQRILAANRPPSEDNPELIDASILEETLPKIEFTLLEDRGDNEISSIITQWWHYFLYGALGFLILEAILTLPKKIKAKSKNTGSAKPARTN